MLQQNPKLIQSVPAPGHPLAGYLNAPLPSQTPNVLIGGKALSIAELLQNAQGDTFQNPATRRVLLQSYWELVGKLAEYNCRLQAEQQAGGTNAPRDLKAASALNLLRQERRVAEIEFVKQQWQLAELIRRAKGDSSAVSEADLPIPTDYPLFKTYETHADKLARMERSRHLGRMIPIQEQLVQSRLSACRETFDLHSGMPASSQDFLQMLSRRTEAFLEMTQAIVDYNKMIAEYASLTIAPGVSRYRLVGALVELPKFNIMAQTQPGTTAYTPMFAPMQAAEQATPAPLTLGNALPQERAGLDSVSNSVMNPVSPAYGRNLAGTESDIAQVSHEERQTAMPPSRPAVMPPISSLDDKPQELPPSAMSDGAQAEY